MFDNLPIKKISLVRKKRAASSLFLHHIVNTRHLFLYICYTLAAYSPTMYVYLTDFKNLAVDRPAHTTLTFQFVVAVSIRPLCF
jgi:hypothetical protein